MAYPKRPSRDTAEPHKKLSKLPSNARISKRPLIRTAIPSPYSSSSKQPKIIYVSTKTPFMSIVKRAEKLLQLSEKRQVQAATTQAKQSQTDRRRHGGRPGQHTNDEIAAIVKIMDDDKDEKSEEVIVKGTGKAIAKVMEVGVWFQQRERYQVRIKTSTVGAIDDIDLEEANNADAEAESGPAGTAMETESEDKATGKSKLGNEVVATKKTRIRQLSVLEASITLR